MNYEEKRRRKDWKKRRWMRIRRKRLKINYGGKVEEMRGRGER